MKYLLLFLSVDCVELNVFSLIHANHIRQKKTAHQAE